MEKFYIPEELMLELRIKYSSEDLEYWFMIDNNVAIEQSLIRVELDETLKETDPPLNLGGKDYYVFCREREQSSWVFVMSMDRNVISFLIDPNDHFDARNEVVTIRMSKSIPNMLEYHLKDDKSFKAAE